MFFGILLINRHININFHKPLIVSVIKVRKIKSKVLDMPKSKFEAIPLISFVIEINKKKLHYLLVSGFNEETKPKNYGNSP